MPGIGSSRLGQLAGIDGLRFWRLHVFPARWFYFNRPNFLDVVRLLGERPQQYLAKVFNLNRRFGDGLAAPMQLTTVVDV